MRKTFLSVVLTVLALGAVAWAQTTVKADQGKPGTQGPWPVTGTINVVVNGGFDGGNAGAVGTYPIQCAGTAGQEQTTTVGAASTNVPATPVATRAYVVICNSAQNASTAIVKCRQDSTAVVFASGNPGQVLLFGDCMISTAPATAGTIRCIADAAGREVTTYECVPR